MGELIMSGNEEFEKIALYIFDDVIEFCGPEAGQTCVHLSRSRLLLSLSLPFAIYHLFVFVDCLHRCPYLLPNDAMLCCHI